MSEGSHIRDPVHNFVELTEEEVRLLATPLLQRLRGIRQLALASLVYPGALHTRFDHTIGVCHVAGMMSKSLGLGAHESRLVRLAALLHDLGHGPFSHVSENALERYGNRDALPADQKKEKIHEVVTGHLIENDKDVVHLLGGETCRQIAKLLAKGHGQPVLRSIVSGPIDADKQDYLLRDSYFCGVQYGVFDLHQLHRSFTLIGEEDEKYLAVDRDGVRALEQFVLAKYYLTTNVYRHRVRLITDQMIVRAIMLGIDIDKLGELRTIYSFDNTPEFFARYIEWDDARFMHAFAGVETKSGELLMRLKQRQLLKQVYAERLQDLPDPEVRELLLAIGKPENDALRRAIEQRIAGVFKEYVNVDIDSDFVIVHGFNVQSVKTTSRNDEAGINIATSPPTPFEDYSSLFQSIKEGYSDGSVEVYAPVSWETRAERRKCKETLREPIREIIGQMAAEALTRREKKSSAANTAQATGRESWHKESG